MKRIGDVIGLTEADIDRDGSKVFELLMTSKTVKDYVQGLQEKVGEKWKAWLLITSIRLPEPDERMKRIVTVVLKRLRFEKTWQLLKSLGIEAIVALGQVVFGDDKYANNWRDNRC